MKDIIWYFGVEKMNEKIYHNYVYLDTNIFSYLCKNVELIKKLFGYLCDNNLSIAFTGAQLVELHDAQKLHKMLITIRISLPSSLIHSWEYLLDQEVRSHPDNYNGSIISYPLNNLLNEEHGIKKIQEIFTSPDLVNARRHQKKNSQKLLSRHEELKSNFPPSKSGKYTLAQAKEFESAIVIQWLSKRYKEFLTEFKHDVSKLNIEVFKSIRLYALVVYFKYYLGNRIPSKLSDFGDLFHLCYLPYCKLAIMEKDLCNILNQIKKHSNILDSTTIKNIHFFDNITHQ